MKQYHVTTYPYVTQTGYINVPGNIEENCIEEYIREHFKDIQLGEPQFDYRGIDLDFDLMEEKT